MHLDEFLFRSKQTQVSFAKKVGVNPQYLSNVIAGRHTPSVKLAKKIEEETQGQVTWVELIEFCEKQKDNKDKNV